MHNQFMHSKARRPRWRQGRQIAPWPEGQIPSQAVSSQIPSQALKAESNSGKERNATAEYVNLSWLRLGS